MLKRRTDLALEAAQLWQESAGEAGTLPGVESEEATREGYPVTTVRIRDEAGARALGKPVGTYVTLELDGLARREEDAFGRAARALAAELGALLGLAVCSTAWLTSYWGQMRAAQQTFEKLAQAVRAAAPQPEEERGEVWQKGVETLQAQNRDCLAWLYSADTGLDHPVMYTPQQPEYYLRRDFEEQYSLAGTPFLDVRSSPADSRNLIIHGHNMKDGSMFAPLRFYLEKEYGLEHSSFELSFADGVRRYALMAVLHIELTPENVEQYYKQPQTQEAFEAFVEMLEQESLYCGGAGAQ